MLDNTPTVHRLYEVAKKFVPSKDVYPTKYSAFDACMDGGLRDGELVTISGSSGEGKTTFAQNLTVNFHRSSVPSLWLSYEMNPHYLLENFVKLEVKPQDLLVYSPIELIMGNLSFIRQEIAEGAKEKAIKMVFIDHLHYLINLKDPKNSSLYIGSIVRQLKEMAVANSVVIFLISHTRKINMGDELSLSSIRDSSLIVCESDYVFLIERRRKKRTAREKMESDYISSGDEFLNQSRVTLAKNRRLGKVLYMDFEVKNGRFIPIEKNEESKWEQTDMVGDVF